MVGASCELTLVEPLAAGHLEIVGVELEVRSIRQEGLDFLKGNGYNSCIEILKIALINFDVIHRRANASFFHLI